MPTHVAPSVDTPNSCGVVWLASMQHVWFGATLASGKAPLRVNVPTTQWASFWAGLLNAQAEPTLVWTERSLWELRAALWRDAMALDIQRGTVVSHLLRGESSLVQHVLQKRRNSRPRSTSSGGKVEERERPATPGDIVVMTRSGEALPSSASLDDDDDDEPVPESDLLEALHVRPHPRPWSPKVCCVVWMLTRPVANVWWQAQARQNAEGVTWDWRSFEVAYPSLELDVCVDGFFLSLLVPRLRAVVAGTSQSPVDDPAALVRSLCEQYAIEDNPRRKLVCLRCMTLLVQSDPQAFTKFERLSFIVHELGFLNDRIRRAADAERQVCGCMAGRARWRAT